MICKNLVRQKKEIEILKDLSLRDDIITITKVDKGGAVGIIDAEDYINDTNRQLNYREFYKEILNDPTETKMLKFNKTINELKCARQ